MDELEFTIPKGIVDSLPADGEATKQDMQKAVAGWQQELDAVFGRDDDELVNAVVDIVEHFEKRWEKYDEYIVELRSWGESPIYAMAWRDLYGSLIQQLVRHGDLSERINRERHARIFDDGMRPGPG